MKQRKWNSLLTIFSVIGGFIGFVVGEWILDRWEGAMHETLLMGLYFGQFALFVGIGCLAAEIISPKLNGNNWRLHYAGDGWKLLVPGTLVLLFVAGVLFQFIYGLSLGKRDVPQDYVLLLDKSESMLQTDPDRQSVRAAQSLIGKMDGKKRAALFTFNEQTEQVFPLTQLSGAGVKNELSAKLEAAYAPNGQTDIGKALNAAMDHLQQQGRAGRNAAVILISDGYSDVDTAKVLAPYVQEHVRVHTIGIDSTQAEGRQLLQQIAANTGGNYYDAQSADRIADAFEQIYLLNHQRHLLNERTGAAASDGYHGLLRAVLITLLGTLLGLSLGIIFDNRYLAASFSIGGTVAGLLAGLIIESGVQGADYPSIYRLMADLILAFVLSVSTLLVAVRQETGGHSGFGRGRRSRVELEPQGRYGRRGGDQTGKRFR
ncbi:vWA domain-containing protein [Paenibacillus doosanensis]|uniref:vWA domain-containing protein n=1 Tax=Paenibacillus doosanensis TaxID=1229154 RepID=UPI00217FE0CD|nr:vWA domain-containing protein [Paenibacillus doosanensis]